MDAEQINCYRVNYNAEHWKNVAKKAGNQCSSPLGAVLAVNVLCDEVERLQKQRDDYCDEMHDAQEELDDAWAKINAITKQRDDLLVALEKVVSRLEEAQVDTDAEYNTGRSLIEIDRDGDLWPEIVIARAAIASAKGSAP